MNSGASILKLTMARVEFSCPKCGARLAVGSPNHRVIATAAGITVTPEFCCECGITGDIKRNKVRVTGRLRIPSNVRIAMPTTAERIQPAIRVEASSFAVDLPRASIRAQGRKRSRKER